MGLITKLFSSLETYILPPYSVVSLELSEYARWYFSIPNQYACVVTMHTFFFIVLNFIIGRDVLKD